VSLLGRIICGLVSGTALKVEGQVACRRAHEVLGLFVRAYDDPPFALEASGPTSVVRVIRLKP
jgi:hypothetical protein